MKPKADVVQVMTRQEVRPETTPAVAFSLANESQNRPYLGVEEEGLRGPSPGPSSDDDGHGSAGDEDDSSRKK